jgi:hypothetical protein
MVGNNQDSISVTQPRVTNTYKTLDVTEEGKKKKPSRYIFRYTHCKFVTTKKN